MNPKPMHIVVFGLSVTSSWGNGHATTYRALLRELAALGHRVTFLERDVPWYASNRDLANPAFCDLHLYSDLDELKTRHARLVETADFVLVGSYVPEGTELARWLFATADCPVGFYDIDTPVTLARIQTNDCFYLAEKAIARYDVYFSFTGGPTLDLLEQRYGSPMARPLYCCVDTRAYYPIPLHARCDLGYLGTYSDDRQRALDELLLSPATRLPHQQFMVAGPQYPASIDWPPNVSRTEHLPPSAHCEFYNAQRFTLNITRRAMVEAGYSPSVRLFEAAACGTAIISDWWDGLDAFFEPDSEILISRCADDTVCYLKDLPDSRRREIGQRARRRILKEHTAAIRAAQLADTIRDVTSRAGTACARRPRESIRS